MSDAQLDAGGETVEGDREPLDDRRNWLSVARKEVADAGRSWQLYVLTGVFVAGLTLGSLEPVQNAMVGSSPGEEQKAVAAREGLKSLRTFVQIVVPLVILIGTHMAIAGERERGSLRVTLALPVSRRDVLVGTALGRAGVVAGTLLAALAVNGIAMWVAYDSMDPLTYAEYSVALVVFGVVFVGIAVGISAATRTSNRAVGTSLGVFLVITILWFRLLDLVELVTGVQPQINIITQNTAPGWWVFLQRMRPGTAWQLVVTDWIVPVTSELGRGENTYYAQYTTPGPEPFYLDSWFLAIVLVAWCVVPLLVGYWRFREADLG